MAGIPQTSGVSMPSLTSWKCKAVRAKASLCSTSTSDTLRAVIIWSITCGGIAPCSTWSGASSTRFSTLYDRRFRNLASPLTQKLPDLYIDVQNAASMLFRNLSTIDVPANVIVRGHWLVDRTYAQDYSHHRCAEADISGPQGKSEDQPHAKQIAPAEGVTPPRCTLARPWHSAPCTIRYRCLPTGVTGSRSRPTPPGFGQIVLCRPDAWGRLIRGRPRPDRRMDL
jgi:hypothetical protein